jgi:CRP-like cAMP-binding protein
MPAREDVRLLASLPAFEEFEAEALRLIAFSAETRLLRAGDVLFRKGDRSTGGYMVLSGAVALDDSISPSLVVGPPTLIGEAALLTATICPATARAQVASSVLRIPRELYRRVLAEYPRAAVRRRRALAAEAIALGEELRHVAEPGSGPAEN